MDSTTQIYLEITLENGDLLGEAMVKGYENRIDINSFRFHAQAKKNTLKDVQKGFVGSNLDLDRVSVSKVFDRATLLLAGALNLKKKFSEAKISIDQQYIDPEWTGKINNEILIIYLYSGFIADIKLRTTEGGTGASVGEDIELSFERCLVYYYAEDRDRAGKLGDDYRWEPCIFEMRRDEQKG